MILSVSRRTDIPAFYGEWFFERLREGYALVPNPINPSKIAKVELAPLKIISVSENLLGEKSVETQGNLEGIVFWTKNPAPIIPRLAELGDIPFYFLYTLNAYPQTIEPFVPPISERIASFKKLAEFCPVVWRYDPILLAEGIDVAWHIEQFSRLCNELQGYTNRCKISFVIESYSGCSKSVHSPSYAEKLQILEAFAQISQGRGIQIEACAEDDWSRFGIVSSRCIDGEIFEKLISKQFAALGLTAHRKNAKLDGQRKNCLCMPSVDIGRYDTCHHWCNYCYAKKGAPKSMLDEPYGEIYTRKTELEFVLK